MTQHFDVHKPLFVRSRHYPVIFKGKTFEYNSHFPWMEMGMEEDAIRMLFNMDRVYHNEELEVEAKIGDRLSELKGEKLKKLVRLTNAMVKKRCTTDKEFQNKKVKGSLIEDKQRGLIRSWINRNGWALEEYYELRDSILSEATEAPAEDTPE